MNEYKNIRVIDAGEVVSLVLTNPPLNVMNIAMMKEMNSALADLQRHPNAGALVLKAEGKAFSAGVDVADHTTERVGEMMEVFHRLFELLHGFRIPTIAVVDGAALGGGCELATYCDMVIASEHSTFGQPEIKVGVFPPIAAAVLPRLIGRNRTLELLMSGETITAVEAERIGLINKVFPDDHFNAGVDDFVKKITSKSKIILEITKRAVDGGLYSPCMKAIMGAENLYMNEMMKTEDAREGLQAFREKRRAVWKNR